MNTEVLFLRISPELKREIRRQCGGESLNKRCVEILQREFEVPPCYDADGEPLQCPECGSVRLYRSVKDTAGGEVIEFAVVCHGCKARVGYWACGEYDPSYAEKHAKRISGSG